MKRFFTLLAFVGILFLLKSCGLTYKAPEHSYTVSLDSVTVNGIVSKNGSSLPLKAFYNDSTLAIQCEFHEKQVGFILENKTSTPISVDWDMCGYVDALGVTHRVIHEGVKFNEKRQNQGRSIVAGKSYLNDILVPEDYIVWSNNMYIGWITHHLLSTAYCHPASTLAGKKVRTNRILLSLEHDGKRLNYDFSFSVTAHPLLQGK